MHQLTQQIMDTVIYPVLAVFFSLLFTWLAIRILPLLGYIDQPGGRHIHKKPTPRGGGIAIVLAFFLVMVFYGAYTLPKSVPGNLSLFWRLLVPSLPLVIVGLIDDRFSLRPWTKLLVQLLVGTLVWITGRQEYVCWGWVMPEWLSLALTIAWVVIIVNAFNLIDGLDGLAAGLALVSSVSLSIWFFITGNRDLEAVTMLIMAGTCVGFLRYNFYPAKIFMGDTGSTFLGLFFAVVGLYTVDRVVTITSLLLPLLVVGVPLFDVFLAIWRRTLRKVLHLGAPGSGIMDADQDHLHHRLLRRTGKQRSTAFILYSLAGVCSCFTLLFVIWRGSVPAIGFAALFFGMLIAIRRLGEQELFDSAMLLRNGLNKPRHGLLANMIHPFVDFSIIVLAYFITGWIIGASPINLELFVCSFTPPVILLCVSGVYRVYWLRAGLYDYWHLALTVLVGALLSCATIYYMFIFTGKTFNLDPHLVRSGFFLFSLLCVVGISLERFLLHYAEGFWVRNLGLCERDKTPVKPERIIIYGGGLACRLYVAYCYNCANRIDSGNVEVIGIIDDDLALKNLRINGFPVLGTCCDLDRIYEENPFRRIVVTSQNMPDEAIGMLRAFVSKTGVKICCFSLTEDYSAAELDRRSKKPESDDITPDLT
ncbi:MAG: hypothetical protein PHI35_05670 [Victivallaceae bacterium]|nr:hypothetical protein [Victivallaceae bacterium]